MLRFDKSYPAVLPYLSGIGSYFTPYANMHLPCADAYQVQPQG